MRYFLLFITFGWLCFHTCSVAAKDNPTPAVPPECTLKNKVFCGEWETNQVFHLNITGDKITYYDARPSDYTCKIIDEFSDDVHPYSILQCTYYDADWSKKNITEFHMFYFSDYDVRRGLESPDLQVVSHKTEKSIRGLFLGYCDPAAIEEEKRCKSDELYPNIYYNNEGLSRLKKN